MYNFVIFKFEIGIYENITFFGFIIIEMKKKQQLKKQNELVPLNLIFTLSTTQMLIND